MATDLETAQARLDLYIQAETAVLSGGQEGQVAGRKWKKADLPEIRAAIKELQRTIADLKAQAGGGSRLYTAVPQ